MHGRQFAKLRNPWVATTALCTWVLGVVAAQAHQSPANCNGNGVVLNMSRSPASVLVGGTVTYNVSIANLDDPSISLVACDVTDAVVVFYCPAPDGTPDFANPVVLETSLDLPAGTPATPIGSEMCTLNVSPGVTDAVADVRAGDQSGAVDNIGEGALHDATVNHPFRSEKQLGTEVVTTTTSTSTSSTSTTTIVTAINHVQCYEAKPAAFPLTTVSAQDQFGTQSLTLRFPHRLCAPVDKNDEGIPNPTAHLTGYLVKSSFAKKLNQTVVDQFGTLQLDVVRPEVFMVPSAKNGVPIAPPAGDHFTCYKVRPSRGAARFASRTVTVVDQFQSVTETLSKPVELCAPANKNGEDPTAPQHPDHLLCYKARSATSFGTVNVSIDNQFGPDQLKLIARRELCVPASKNPGASTTSTSTTITPTTSSTSTTVVGSPSGSFLDGV